jgi:F-type H+-transporting ATPase subunit delta
MAKASRRALAKIVAERLSAANADGRAVMREVAAYLIENNMLADADAFINDLAEELYAQTGRLVVEVTSARPLTDEARGNLVKYLQDETQAQSVELHEIVDESLIGGLVAKTPAAELDISVRNALRQLTALA